METFFDTHAHLDAPQFDKDREEVIARARDAGVRYIVTIGADLGLQSAQRAVEIARSHENIWATAGVHPHDAKLMDDDDLDRIMKLASNDKVVAIGEIGLDYVKKHSPRDVQLARFRQQLGLARELNLPVVIHDREAHEDFHRVIRDDGIPEAGGIMHCFSGSAEMAKQLARKGFYISLPGVITFRNAKKPLEVARKVQEDRILIETDCPYLTPEPLRGKRNEPAYVKFTAEAVARARKAPLKRIAEISTENAFRAFGINPPGRLS